MKGIDIYVGKKFRLPRKDKKRLSKQYDITNFMKWCRHKQFIVNHTYRDLL